MKALIVCLVLFLVVPIATLLLSLLGFRLLVEALVRTAKNHQQTATISPNLSGSSWGPIH